MFRFFNRRLIAHATPVRPLSPARTSAAPFAWLERMAARGNTLALKVRSPAESSHDSTWRFCSVHLIRMLGDAIPHKLTVKQVMSATLEPDLTPAARVTHAALLLSLPAALHGALWKSSIGEVLWKSSAASLQIHSRCQVGTGYKAFRL